MVHNKLRCAASVFSWLLVLFCMYIIFSFSAQTGEASAEESLSVLGKLMNFVFIYIDHNTFRKIAHFLEYCALSFLCYNAFFHTRSHLKPYVPFAISFLYCVSDEIHQYFVPGRACRLFDIGVDTCGIILGLLVFRIFAKIVVAIIKKAKVKRGK